MGKNVIAKIVIDGVIEKENETYSQKWILDTISKLEKKKKVVGILLYINSPGGGVYESDEVYQAIKRYKANTKKPVFAYFAALAASGGYYIGCSADRIFANRNTLTGSIGVICGRFLDLSELFSKHGIKDEIIHTGRNKIMGNISTPATDEQREIMQCISDECYEQFVSLVSESRKLPLDSVKELSDGRIYTAKQARENGLIDDILEYKDVKDIFIKTLDNQDAVISEFKYKGKKSFMNKLLKGKSNASLELLTKAKAPFPAYFFDTERFGR